MRVGIVLLSLVILLLLTAVLPVGKGLSATAIYYSPVMILLLALLSASSVWCCIKRKLRVRQIGFYLVHLGVVVILAGAFVGYVAGEKGMIQVPLNPSVVVRGLMDDPSVEFGFEVGAEDFEVQFYPPIYHLYRQVPPDRMQAGQMPFEMTGEFDTEGKTVLILNELGPFNVSNLWNESRKEWAQRRMLDSGAFLHLASQTPSHYGVTLQIVDGGDELELPISINHPAKYQGWRFYLVSYDQLNQRFVQLSARRDPGRNAVIAGIWMLIAGTFALCFRRQAGSLRYVSQASCLPLENDGQGGVA